MFQLFCFFLSVDLLIKYFIFISSFLLDVGIIQFFLYTVVNDEIEPKFNEPVQEHKVVMPLDVDLVKVGDECDDEC